MTDEGLEARRGFEETSMRTKTTVSRLVLPVLLPILLSLVTPALAASWPDWADEAGAGGAMEPRYGGEDAVVLLDQWEITLKGGQRTGTRRWGIKVLTEDGRAYASLPIARGSFDTFSRVKVWVRDPGGSVHFFGEDEGTLFSYFGRKFLDDTEVLLLQPRGISPGSAMAVEYHFRSLPDIPCDLFPIQGPVPVLHSRVHVDARGGWMVRARVSPGAISGPTEVTDEGLWELRDVPGRPKASQPLSPQPLRQTLILNYVPPGKDSVFADWASTSRWGAALFGETSASRLESLASQIRAGGLDPVAEAGRLARKLRYFAIEIGWGGFRPRAPDTTLARGFGDCKDKSALMVSLLRRLGLDAFPVLAVAPMYRQVDERLASPRHFNHCIVGILWKDRARTPGMTIVDAPGLGPIRLFDATLSDDSAQDVPVILETGAALPLDPRSQGLVRLRGSGPDENVVETTHVWHLDASGTLQVRILRRHLGAMRVFLEGEGGELIKTDELRRRLFQEFSRRHARIERFESSEVRRDPDGAWSYEVSYTSPSAMEEFGDVSLLPMSSFVSLDAFPVPNEKKKVSLYQPFLATFRESYIVDFSGLTMLDVPRSFQFTQSLGSISVTARGENDRVIVDRKMTIDALEIPESKREEAAAMRRALRKANAVSIVFRARVDRRDATGESLHRD